MQNRHVAEHSTRERYRVARDRAWIGGKAQSTCRKFCFPSKRLAKQAMKRLIGSGDNREPDCPMHPHLCMICNCWHYGHDRTHMSRKAG